MRIAVIGGMVAVRLFPPIAITNTKRENGCSEFKATIQPGAFICAATDRQSEPRVNSFARALIKLIVSTVSVYLRRRIHAAATTAKAGASHTSNPGKTDTTTASW